MDVSKFKLALSLSILLIAAMAVPIMGVGNATSHPSSGMILDFNDRDVVWTGMDTSKYSNPISALEYVCGYNGFSLTLEGDTVIEIDGTMANEIYEWCIWGIAFDSTSWRKIQLDSDIRDFTICAWAYCNSDDVPTVAVDASGRSIYGYPRAERSVTLAPSLTEILGSLNAIATLVGTDSFSNYPNSVVVGKSRGSIATVGDYLNPSFELILQASPDIIFCDGSLQTHKAMVEKLRNIDRNAVMMYGGDSIQTIRDNIFIMGVSMGYEIRANEVLDLLDLAQSQLVEALGMTVSEVDMMYSLSADKAPFISGSGTYIDDISIIAYGNNVYSNKSGWVRMNPETIMTNNPSKIIIFSTEYSATERDYNAIMNSLSAEWRSTDAYKSGEIYIICESAGEMSQRPSPRYAQIMELTMRIIHPGAFTETDMGKFIGNDYVDYLTYTKHLSFNG